MSSIFYRFKSQKTDSRLPIDGTGISVFDLKKEIILANHMGDGKDFDLGLYDAGNEEGQSARSLARLPNVSYVPTYLKPQLHN